MTTNFEIMLVDGGNGNSLIAIGRRGADTAIEHIPMDAQLTALVQFGQSVGGAVTDSSARPTKDALSAFGNDLFSFLFRGSLIDLYTRMPTGQISLQILSDHPSICELPWEYIATPDRNPVPHRDRSIIRIHPTRGVYHSTARKFKKIRVLFVSADPIDQQGISSQEVLAQIRRVFSLQMDEAIQLKVVEGATREGLIQTIGREQFDVFHFYGHGEVDQNGTGSLILQDIQTQVSDRINATDLAIALNGKGVQLAILSACLTGTGNFGKQFDVITTALITCGIPAVIANQYPIPYKTISPFVGIVYNKLIETGDIDAAVAEGRAYLAVSLSNTTSKAVIEWGIPVLYRLADARQLFAI